MPYYKRNKINFSLQNVIFQYLRFMKYVAAPVKKLIEKSSDQNIFWWVDIDIHISKSNHINHFNNSKQVWEGFVFNDNHWQQPVNRQILPWNGLPRILVISTYVCLGQHCKLELVGANHLILLASTASNITHADSVRDYLSSLGHLGWIFYIHLVTKD